MTFEDIATISRQQLKAILKEAVKREAFNELTGKQADHSKTRDLRYTGLQLQPYLSSQRASSIKQKALFFKFRCRMIDVKDNFKFGKTELLCKCCHNEVESQHHLLNCPMLQDSSLVADLPAYEDLFSEDADKIEKIGKILIEKYEKFKKFTPSAHSAITSEDPSEDNDDNVRASIGEYSDSLYYCLSSGIGI